MAKTRAGRRMGRLRKRFQGFRSGVKNTMELLREGRLSVPWQAAFNVEHSESVFRLRRYPKNIDVDRCQQPILLVPPLMVAAEIYDISPELSAVGWMAAEGADVWLVDFGAPEIVEGGMERTLDDHVLAVSRAIDVVRKRSGQDVHLAGYSQGGMFVYQAAAYRRCEGIASLITFGSPVDLHRNMPNVHEDVAGRVIATARPAAKQLVNTLGGIPGPLSAATFKALSASKELKQMAEFFRVIHDRDRAERLDQQRRFLGGDGFVAWPGPAVKTFIDEMLVNNRMMTGGLMIGSTPVSLADIHCPILYFVGSRDEFGRPASVRAINKAAPNAVIREIELQSGHFGLVVGSKSLRITWPTVLDWMCWQEGTGDEPNFDPDKLRELQERTDESVGETAALYDVSVNILDALWHRIGDTSTEVAQALDNLRWQVSRLTRIRQLDDTARASMSQALAEQAQVIGERTFFLWGNQGYSYREADERVDQIAAALHVAGVVPREPVAILMENHPDYLTVVCALNRLGAVAVLINADAGGQSVLHALEISKATRLIFDPANSEKAAQLDAVRLHEMADNEGSAAQDDRYLLANLPSVEEARRFFEPHDGRATELALLIFTSGTTGLPKAVRISNRRWVAGALSAAASAHMTTRDTVYCCLPLYHATGMIVSVGAALVGGCRLALASKFSASQFMDEVHRYGVTVVTYVGELCRYLVNTPAQSTDQSHAIRLFMGNGLRPEIWREMNLRFPGAHILEFYASTEGNVGLVNLTGKKLGSVGRPLVDSAALEIVQYDVPYDEVVRDDTDWLVECEDDEVGLLIARIDSGHPLTRFDGYADDEDTERKIIRDAFEEGDAWFNTGDLLRRDRDGDYWFVDRIGDTFRWRGENVSTQQVADVLDSLPFVKASAVYGIEVADHEGRAGMAAIELQENAEFDGGLLYMKMRQNLSDASQPRAIRVVDSLDATQSMKFVKYGLQSLGVTQNEEQPLFVRSHARASYVPLEDVAKFPKLVDM